MPQSRSPDPSRSSPTTHLATIAAQAKANKDTDQRYREWLKERSPLSNDQLDQLVQDIRAHIEPRIDCVACNHCCRTLQVVVDRKDIARLARRLGTTPDEFTRHHVDTAPDGVQHLRRKPCPLLGNDGACTVYEDRPKACRDYPYVDTPRFRGRSLVMLDNVGHCPIVHNLWETLKAEHPTPTVPTDERGTPGDPRRRKHLR